MFGASGHLYFTPATDIHTQSSAQPSVRGSASPRRTSALLHLPEHTPGGVGCVLVAGHGVGEGSGTLSSERGPR